MFNFRNYPSSQMSDLNLDWIIENVKKAVDAVDIVIKEWADIKGTAQKIVDDEVEKWIHSGELDRIVSKAVADGLLLHLNIQTDQDVPLILTRKQSVLETATEMATIRMVTLLDGLS